MMKLFVVDPDFVHLVTLKMRMRGKNILDDTTDIGLNVLCTKLYILYVFQFYELHLSIYIC